MMDVSEQKKELRQILKKKRGELAFEVWREKSDQIVNHILKDGRLQKFQKIHCFVSMNERFEVDTHSLIKQWLKQGKEVVVSISDFETSSLTHTKLSSFEDLAPNTWGILEPQNVNEVPSTYADLIFVPLLAMDERGNRLGYGKGFYDRFLAQSTALKLGLVFEDFVLEKIPVDEFDQPLDGFISEKGVRYLKQ